MNANPLFKIQAANQKMTPRYDMSGRWFKGSLHLHTQNSDGYLSIEQVVRKYADESYDFLSITDHWRFPHLNGNRKALPLLVINGMELDGYDYLGAYYHVLAIGCNATTPHFSRNFLKTMRSAHRQGALLIWAHPYWTGNSIHDGLRYEFHGLEIYNHTSHCENGSGYALSYWDGMLKHNPNFLGFATDDSHFAPGEPYWKGGWIMVNAADCSQFKILESIRKGNFYATQGPEFKTIQYGHNTVVVETSPAAYVRLIGPRRKGRWVSALGDENPICLAEFERPSDWPYMRIEIEDFSGKRAWTNPLWRYC